MDALELLYGFRPDVKRIVGAHEHKDDSLLVYQRLEDDRIRKRVAKFKPYGMFHHGVVDALQEQFVVEEVSELKGPGRIDRMVRFKGFVQFHKIKSWARKELGDDDYFIETDPVTQWLQQTGITFFGGMAMDDILRMQIDLEVWSDGQFPNAERESDYIFIIAISDNRGYEEALYVEGDAEVSIDGPYRRMPNEERMLRELVKIIHRRDPDSLEFHNGVGFDLPYLRDRCEMHGVNFGIGRDNSVPRSFTRSKDFAEAEIEFQSFQIAGRSVIDSMFEAMDYDVYKRDLPGYGLKQVAKHFGVAAEDRTYIEGSKLASTWDSDPDRVLRYALDDVRETKAIMEVLGDKSFELTSMVPWKYQKVQTGGQAKAIEALMARSYIRAGYAFPERQTSGTYQGAYSELFRRGVFENLTYADVSSLYPSNMMVYRITSQNDYLGTFLPLLEGLTELRLKTKKKMREMEDGPERRRLDAKQSSYKTLINSFYGALGTRFFQWCDIQGASKVCLKGQYILKRMIHEIRDRGGTVVLCDTDGVLFKYPEGMSKDDVNALIQEISESMPDGIEIDNDGFFDKAIAYKPKNYALLPAGEDEFKVKGVSLKGRSKEPFLLEFLQRQLQYIFDGDVQAAHDDYMNLTRQIAAKNLSVDALSKRARVKMNLDTYIEKKVEGDENQLPQYEVALRADKIHDYDVLKGDMFRYYIGGGNAKHYKSYKRARLVEEYDNDENVYHYLDRLKKTVEILQEMVEKPGAVYPDPHHIAAQHGLFDDSEQDLGGLVTKVVKEVPDNPSDRKVFP